MKLNGTRPVIAVLSNLLELNKAELTGIVQMAAQADVGVCILPVGMTGSDYPGCLFHNRIKSLLSSPRFSGVIFMASSLLALAPRDQMAELLVGWQGRPMVSIGEQLFAEPVVRTDQAAGLTELLDHLLGHHGYRNPVFIAAPGDSLDARTRNGCFHAALARHGLEDDPLRFVTGDWTLNGGRQAIQEIYDHRQLRPDVLVFANDYMALGARDYLLERGVLVPEDVAMSGFDGLILSRNMSSRLASVRLPGQEAGETAFRMLMGILAGEPCQDITLGSIFLPADSCGCSHLNEIIRFPALADRLAALPPQRGATRTCKAILDMELLDTLNDSYHLQHIDNMTNSLVRDFFSSHSIEGHEALVGVTLDSLGISNFYLSVCQEQAGSVAGPSNLLVAREKWHMKQLPQGGLEFDSLLIIPLGLEPQQSIQGVLFPFRSGNFHFGNIFMDFRRDFIPAAIQLCDRLAAGYLWIRESQRLHLLNQELDEAKQHLEALSLTDELTRLHNRRGFLALATPRIQACRQNRQGFWIIFLDLDGLKHINDTWGHNEGDKAIQAFSGILKKVFRGEDLIARLGGDEFIAFVHNVDAGGMDRIKTRLQQALDRVNTGSSSWQLGTSLGAYWSAPESTLPIGAMMMEADLLLYEDKKRKKQA